MFTIHEKAGHGQKDQQESLTQNGVMCSASAEIKTVIARCYPGMLMAASSLHSRVSTDYIYHSPL
jgi:hypothetical protein